MGILHSALKVVGSCIASVARCIQPHPAYVAQRHDAQGPPEVCLHSLHSSLAGQQGGQETSSSCGTGLIRPAQSNLQASKPYMLKFGTPRGRIGTLVCMMRGMVDKMQCVASW